MNINFDSENSLVTLSSIIGNYRYGDKESDIQELECIAEILNDIIDLQLKNKLYVDTDCNDLLNVLTLNYNNKECDTYAKYLLKTFNPYLRDINIQRIFN